MERKQRVYLRLKTKVGQFGFNRKQLKGVAADIADKLESDENASEEELDAEIDKAIDAVIPSLKLAQSLADSLVEDRLRQNENENDEDDEDDEDDDSNSSTSSQSGQSRKKTRNKTEEKQDAIPEWAKGLMDSVKTLSEDIASIRSDRLANTRRTRLEELVKDSGTFGSSKLKDFSRMKFESDDDFDDYLSEVKTDLEQYRKENPPKKKTMGIPPFGTGEKGDEDLLSEDDIKALVPGDPVS